MSYEISKKFEFDFGHRVWTQEVDTVLSCGRLNVCRHLHGHRGTVEIVLKGELSESGMITDFSNLLWLKQWINDYIDHKMLLDVKDPLLKEHNFPTREDCRRKSDLYIPFESGTSEIWNGIVLVDFVPTAENLAHMFAHQVQNMLYTCRLTNFKVDRVIFYETPSSTATYRMEHKLDD